MTSECEAKVAELRRRIKQRQHEVRAFLDVRFYSACRNVLHSVIGADKDKVFRTNPLRLPEYLTRVRSPMYWDLIEKRLDKYEYASSDSFVSDMRLVIDNCYAYNGLSAAVSTGARDLEILMENLFIKELGVTPPLIAEVKALGNKLLKQTSLEVGRIYCLYENKEEIHSNTKVHINLGKCHAATLRRILLLLHKSATTREAKQRSIGASARLLASAPVKNSVTSAPLSAQPHPNSIKEEGKSEVRSGSGTGPIHLERIPQNARSGVSTLREISPIRMEDEYEGEEAGMFGSEGSVAFASE